MKKIAALVAGGALLLSAAAVFAGGPAEKATGYVEYYQPGYFFDFNAHEERDGRPAKGEAWNYTSGGDWYHASVKCTVVDGSDAWFVAYLEEKSVPSWGPYVWIKVHDEGTPGTEGDYLRGQFISSDPSSGCTAPSAIKADPAGGPWDVLSGNLQVHTYDGS